MFIVRFHKDDKTYQLVEVPDWTNKVESVLSYQKERVATPSNVDSIEEELTRLNLQV